MSASLQAATAVPVDDSISDSDSASDSLSPEHDEGWEDVEPEDDAQAVVGLFSSDIYPNARLMLKEAKERYNFDLIKVQKDLDLDFLDTVKLVNYIRSEVKTGNQKPDVSSKSLFEDDSFLKPVLEDDALLYNLDDLADEPSTQGADVGNSAAEKRISELQEDLERLQGQFTNYRLAVQKTMNDQLLAADETISSSSAAGRDLGTKGMTRTEEVDADYFTSYSYNAIHEIMLKDAVRTDAYRDFIYDNKGLFKDKIVLDVGCGTGILSMFCAKAGAKMVIAVDNSNIIERARENIYNNGFGDVIKCLRGKIEEITLPVPQVDIIVSEWMGYGLLFEAMLDSVLWARDRYLTSEGLMVPSHATLRIAPFVDSEFVDSHVAFWKNVYGFDMSSMLTKIHDEAIVSTTKPSSVAAQSTVFLQLPLHTITVDELIFVKNFEVTVSEDVPGLDGWTIWFDIFFMPSRTSKFQADSVPSDMRKQGLVAFTTGPYGPETHWQQCVLLVNHGSNQPVPLRKGQVIKGEIVYRKKEIGSRSLDIDVVWSGNGVEKEQQTWSLQ